MQAAPPGSHPPPTTPDQFREVLERCAQSTLDALVARNHLQADERQHIEKVHLEALAEGKQAEIFETITRLSTVGPREIPDFMTSLGLAVTKTLKARAPVIPGLTRLPAPADFYERYPNIQQLARALLVPVLYSEDDEAIGVGSVNPVPALQVAGAITSAVEQENGTRPYLSTVRLDYDAWQSLLSRHFSL